MRRVARDPNAPRSLQPDLNTRLPGGPRPRREDLNVLGALAAVHAFPGRRRRGASICRTIGVGLRRAHPRKSRRTSDHAMRPARGASDQRRTPRCQPPIHVEQPRQGPQSVSNRRAQKGLAPKLFWLSFWLSVERSYYRSGLPMVAFGRREHWSTWGLTRSAPSAMVRHA